MSLSEVFAFAKHFARYLEDDYVYLEPPEAMALGPRRYILVNRPVVFLSREPDDKLEEEIAQGRLAEEKFEERFSKRIVSKRVKLEDYALARRPVRRRVSLRVTLPREVVAYIRSPEDLRAARIGLGRVGSMRLAELRPIYYATIERRMIGYVDFLLAVGNERIPAEIKASLRLNELLDLAAEQLGYYMSALGAELGVLFGYNQGRFDAYLVTRRGARRSVRYLGDSSAGEEAIMKELAGAVEAYKSKRS